MEVCIDHQEFLSALLMLKQTYQCLIMSSEISVPVVGLLNIIKIHSLLTQQLKFLLLVANQHGILVSSVMQTTFVTVFLEFWLVHCVKVINFLKAHNIRLNVSTVKYLLDDTL